MTLSREQILATSIPSEVVDVPEWGGKVTLRGLTAAERDDYEQSLVDIDDEGKARKKAHLTNVRASLVVRCVVDESGERVFTDADVDALGAKSGMVIDRLWDIARRLSGMGTEEETKALVEDFGTAQGGKLSSV